MIIYNNTINRVFIHVSNRNNLTSQIQKFLVTFTNDQSKNVYHYEYHCKVHCPLRPKKNNSLFFDYMAKK